MSRFTKTMVFAALTAALIGVSWWLQATVGLHDPAPFLRALAWLPGVGIVLLSVGIFLRRGGTALFLDAVGGVTLAAGLILFVLYGGMDNTAAPGADTAVNLVLCLWTALPVSFLIRTLVLVGGSREDSRPRRLVQKITATLLVLWLAVLLISGQMLHLVHLEETGADTGEDVAWIGTGEDTQ